MPRKIIYPFDSAKQAMELANNKNRKFNIDFLRDYLREEKNHMYDKNLTDCDLATIAYLALHRSFFKSGIRYTEYLLDIAADPKCKFIDKWEIELATSEAEDMKSEQESLRQRYEEEKRNKMIYWVGGGSGLSIMVIGAAFIISRRRKNINT